MEQKVIWVICKYASPVANFFGTRHYSLGEEWVKKGHKVYLFTSNSNHLVDNLPRFWGSRMIENINGVNIIWLNILKLKFSSSFKRVLSWIQFEIMVLFTPKSKFDRPDVIIASSLSLLSIISAFFLSKIYRSKFILEIRDIWPLSGIELGGYSTNHPFIRLLSVLEKFGYRNADVIVGTMPNLQQHVEKVEPNYKKCVCIPQGINEDFINCDFKTLDEEFLTKTFTPNTFKIGYAGTLNPNNPIEILLEAIKQIPISDKIEAYILGKGSNLEKFKNKYSIYPNIKFLDPIPKIYVRSFLNEVDICFDSVESSIGRFGLSRNKWIDYMNAGKPILCASSGFQSMLNEAECGMFVPFNNLESLKTAIFYYKNLSKEELVRIGRNGQIFLRDNRLYSNLAKKYEDLFA